MKLNLSGITDRQKKLLNVEDRNLEVTVPDDFIQGLVNNVLERSYLEGIGTGNKFPNNLSEYIKTQNISWLAVKRLPVPPGKIEEYSLLPRWQSALSTIHILNYRLIYVILRQDSRTNLYLGLMPNVNQAINEDTSEKLFQSVTCQMPGIELAKLNKFENISYFINNFNACGAVTGIPSPRKAINYGIFQTLDQVALGIRNVNNCEKDFALVIISDPVQDRQINETTRILRNLSSEIHSYVQYSKQSGKNENNSLSLGASIGIGSLLSLFGVGGAVMNTISGAGMFANTGGMPGTNAFLGGLLNVSANTTTSIGMSESVSYQYLDKSAQYCEQLIDKHVERLQNGRSLGFWNTGIYVLAEQESIVSTVMGMLRSIYSGDDSYIEPIRTHIFPQNSGASEIVKKFNLLPVYNATAGNYSNWHSFGTIFEWISTPINTEELSIATSLPRRDVPGLRFVRNAVRFATNPPPVNPNDETLTLGTILDTGIPIGQNYNISINSLVKHGLITGITGSGKSTTCRNLLSKAMESDLPFLVIEPAKEEYVRWAIQHNNRYRNEPEKQIHIYMPGVKEYDGYPVEELRMNPFQPASIQNAYVNIMSRLDWFKSVMIASLPMADVLPVIVEEALYNHAIAHVGEKYLVNEYRENEVNEYPLIGRLPETADRIISARGYEKSVADNIKAAVRTRINAIIRGFKKDIFNVIHSMNYKELFDRRVVINLSKVADNKDKSMIMALVLMSMHEYRGSKYTYDLTYRNRADQGKVCHLALIEEAHRLLSGTGVDHGGSGNPQGVVAGMFSEMLSEIRAYGQGLLIVDQVPSRLIPDAVKNTNLKITHRLVSADDRKTVASCMGLRADQEDIISVLQPGEAVVCSDYDDAATWIKVTMK